MSNRKIKVPNRREVFSELSPAQETFFFLGYTWPFLADPEYPFENDDERSRLWEIHRERLMARMYAEREPGDLRAPGANHLRPREWWFRDAPEEKIVLNGALRVPGRGEGVWTKQPAKESDYEYLQRLGLLTDDDRRRVRKIDFIEAEQEDINYRNYLIEQQGHREVSFEK